MRRDYSDTTVIAPTLNEADNIGLFLGRVTKRYPGIRVIVPDDGSSDATKAMVKRASERNRRVVFLDRSGERVHGVTASIADAAMLVKTPNVISMDADFQHPLGKVGEIAPKLAKYDLVIGVRVGPSRRGAKRRVLSKGLVWIALALFRARGRPTCNDMASGFFGIRTKLLKELISNNEGAFVLRGNKTLLDILRIAGRGISIGEVRYPNFPERKRGRSKFTARIILLSLASALK